jgi:hypothetical protein
MHKHAKTSEQFPRSSSLRDWSGSDLYRYFHRFQQSVGTSLGSDADRDRLQWLLQSAHDLRNDNTAQSPFCYAG